MFKLLKRLFNKNSPEEQKVAKLNSTISDKTSKFTNFIQDKFYEVIEEYSIIRKKLSNLLQTNYDLGLKHIERGNISEAIFRFRFIKKFWPDCHDAYYQLAYCLILAKKYQKAQEVLQELISKDPTYQEKASELLQKIQKDINQSQ